MLYTITPAEMKRVENRVMAETAITGEQLMQSAAAHIAEAVCRYAQTGRIVAVCGTGNNGGDGIAALRRLGENVKRGLSLWLLEGELSPDCTRELSRLKESCPHAEILILSADPLACPAFPQDTACVIDALFGTGLSRDVTGMAATLCQQMNSLHAAGTPIVAVDIPSGLCGESGRILGIAAEVTETITFHRPKPGLWLGLGPNHTGRVAVKDIGIPPEWDAVQGLAVLEPSDLPKFLPPRKPVTHKGSYGRVLAIAGSRGMVGAAALCATAALRTGAGLVTVDCPENILDTVQHLCPCATCLPPNSDPFAAFSQADAIALGCGLHPADALKSLRQVLKYTADKNTPLVIDAEGLNALAKDSEDYEIRLTPAQILTPHPAEAARLLDCSVAEITASPVEAAKRLQTKYGASVLLKGAVSVLLSGEQEGLNILGTPALAKGGSGDVLAGILAALLANVQKGSLSLSVFEVMQVGTALHGLAAKAAAQKFGQRGVLATDICNFLGQDFSTIG